MIEALTMRNTVAWLLPLLLATPAAAQEPTLAGPAIGCASLTTVQIPDVRITAATPTEPAGALKVAHCKVTGVIEREIGFEALLPDRWNERFAMGGGGGFVGQIANQIRDSLNNGYATIGTDTGHRADGTDASWALNRPDRLINYAHAAVHRTADAGKAILRAYYGRPARFSYFFGCSNGGRQALMEAQRYPADFDGIVSGAPALNFTHIAAAFVRNAQATYPDPQALTAATITQENLTLLAEKVLETCDAGDGLTDGVLDDPRACRFSAASLPACPDNRAGPACVTASQREAIARIYAPVVSGKAAVYPGQPFGGEAERGGWRAWITGPMSDAPNAAPSLQWAFGSQFFKYFVFADPAWDYSRYDLGTWARDTRQAAALLNADDPDLDAFRARRGKLLLWHGWSDAALNALETIRYYDRVLARSREASDAVRLFMMPGVQHCGGGAGPDSVDWLGAISAWVERGEVPERILARKRDAAGAALRTRPLCPYPQRAVYAGTGSPDEAQNFACRSR